jgi:hypothetical protein
LQHTDMTMNGRGDGLEPDLPLPMDDFDSSNADTRNLLSPMNDSKYTKADTRGKPARPAAKNTDLAKKGKAAAKENKETSKGGLTSSRKRRVETEADEEERGETEEMTQEKTRVSERTKRDADYKE